MKTNQLYYFLKPYLPWRLRIAVRRTVASSKRKRVSDVWPINTDAGCPPSDWQGWPGGKKFALVLTHDVEGSAGLAQCRDLADLERSFGFRSSFNFIPEGEYSVPAELRHSLEKDGFEVGVHDLHHDGKLYDSRAGFSAAARRINEYLEKWGAKGFRSGFMLHNLDWLGDLNVSYDASTFDTDPFEPQTDGANTIFPFWVSQPNGRGFVELPYTLPQDSTLFLLLQERTIDIWRRKLDWIVQCGGMALVNVHPDYLHFTTGNQSTLSTVRDHYVALLRYLKTNYAGAYWHALPHEVAAFTRARREHSLEIAPQFS